MKESLGIRSKIGVPFEIGGKRRGMVMIASLKPDRFSSEDVHWAETIVRWTGLLAHRAELAEEMRRNSIEQSRRATADELVEVVAHDLRNYLAPVEMRLQTLRLIATRDSPSEALLMEIERIFNSVHRLRALVSDLLDVARLDHGLFRLEPNLLDIVGLAQDSARALETPHASIEVRVQSTGRILLVADGARIRQCIDNLIANAIEKSPEGGTVTVAIGTETMDDGEYARIQVIDEGPGVPPDILPRIFERHATSKSGGGLGLGLFLAKRIAELHGGELSVESKPGQGARFKLSLPCQLHAAERDDGEPRRRE